MSTSPLIFTQLSDDELLAEVQRLAVRERQATAALIRSLMELDARRLYLAAGYSSLFIYCTQVLHLSEHAALSRIDVARASRRQPLLVAAIDEGAINVTCARLLAPHLTNENCKAVLGGARHKTKREVEEIVVRLRPLPPVPSTVRKLPAPKASRPALPATDAPAPALAGPRTERMERAASTTPAPASHRPVMTPVAPERYKVQFTISSQTREKLRRVQDLLRHSIPNGDPAAIFDRALSALMKELERTRLAATDKPRESPDCAAGSRHVPAAVRRAVWARDGGQCAFIGSQGRCGERGFLQLHHVVPFAAGGTATEENLQIRCAAHNRYEAFLFFGGEGPDQARERGVRWDAPQHQSRCCELVLERLSWDERRVPMRGAEPSTFNVRRFPVRDSRRRSTECPWIPPQITAHAYSQSLTQGGQQSLHRLPTPAQLCGDRGQASFRRAETSRGFE